MSDNPRGQVDLGIPNNSPAEKISSDASRLNPANTNFLNGADFIEVNHCVVMEAEHASRFIPGKDANWRTVSGLGYNGGAVSIFPATAAVRATTEDILAGSPCLEFTVWLQNSGDWKVTVRALPTFSVEKGKPQRYAIAFDDAPPRIIPLPVSTSESDKRWQENVLRNAALASSVHPIASSGRHTLKIWMVDPGIVLDTISEETGGADQPGYLWPAETRTQTRLNLK